MNTISKIKSLIFPNTLINSIKTHTIEIKGSLALSFALILEFFILAPLFSIVLFKSLLENNFSFITSFQSAVAITVLILVFVPLANLLFDGTILYFSLKLFRSPIGYSRTILARTIGLIPLILLIPLKAILYSPSELVPNFFWPPWTGLIVTVTSGFIEYPPELARFILENSFTSQIKLIITFILVLWTFTRTSKNLRKIGELDSNAAYLATAIQMLVWDFLALIIATLFTISF
ncbi:MAG: hypothetical protein ACTSR2_09240 [Candidatus Hodarchaeales archaeon]